MTQPLPSETTIQQFAKAMRKCFIERMDIAGPASVPPKTINIHIEGGLVQEVTGIPENFEVHVYDHDAGDVFHPSWDAEKECFVTVYGGDGI